MCFWGHYEISFKTKESVELGSAKVKRLSIWALLTTGETCGREAPPGIPGVDDMLVRGAFENKRPAGGKGPQRPLPQSAGKSTCRLPLTMRQLIILSYDLRVPLALPSGKP